MNPSVRLAVVLAVALVALSACGMSDDGPGAGASSSPATSASGTPTASAAPSGTASPSPSGGSAALPDDLRTRPAVVAAITDAAAREGVDPSQVVIAAWTAVTWNDGSLGCPQEGKNYTQSLVPGELLLLRVGSALSQYHSGAGAPFAHCANPSSGYTVGS